MERLPDLGVMVTHFTMAVCSLAASVPSLLAPLPAKAPVPGRVLALLPMAPLRLDRN